MFMDRKVEVKTILRNLVLTNEDFVYVSGSVIEGHGNKKSDLDIYVISHDIESVSSNTNITYNSNGVLTAFSKINEVSCDIEYWDVRNLNNLITQLDNINLTDLNMRVFNSLNVGTIGFEDLLSFLHRFLKSQSIYNESIYNKYIDNLNDDTYFKISSLAHINLIDNFYDDITGNLQNEEYETALILANKTILKAMVVYLLGHKVSIDREKWLYIKLNQLSEYNFEAKNILDQFKELYFKSNLKTKSDYEEKTEQIIEFINKVISLSNKNLWGEL